MSESVTLTTVFTPDEKGWTMAQLADVDHMIDLQLGGADAISNLGALDASVNRSLGAQIACQIRNLPTGTRVASVTIC